MVGWRVHDLREVLHNELHARPSVVVTAPAQVRSWAFLIEPDEHEAARQHWQQLTQMGVIAAVAVDIRPITTTPPDHFLSAIDPFGPTTVAAKIGDGAGWLITDLQLHDGMTRFTIINAAIMPWQLGRIVYRLRRKLHVTLP
jgi:uncharacterized membrane-anchored protein